MPAWTRREMAQVIGIALIVLAISSVPYLLGYHFEPADMEFGGFLVDLDDSHSHLAKMQQGLRGGWRYRILFTPEEHPGAYLNTFYLGLGKISSFSGLSLIQTYQAARLACGLSLLIMAYVFLSLFLETLETRMVAYLLICLSSGLGWVIMLSGSPTLAGLSPIDFWLMDAYTFFTIFTFPHACAAVTLLLLLLTLVLRYFETFQLRTLILASLATLGLCVVHPFTTLLVDGILVTYCTLLLVKRKMAPVREASAVTIWALTPIPLVAYYYHAFVADPVFQGWSIQNILPSPPLAHLVLGYGIVLLFAVGGFACVIQGRNERALLLAAWVIGAFVLLYLPFNLQRRMLEGLHVPLCVLATIGLFEYALPLAMRSGWLDKFAHWRGYGRTGLRRLLLYSAIITTFPSNLYLIAASGVSALTNSPQLYYEQDEVEAVDWLAKNSQYNDTVLASYEIGRYIPARIGHRVFMGHFIETVDVSNKKRLAERFFQADTTDHFRRDLLTQYGIHYVFHGPMERSLGGFDPSGVSYLTRAFANSSVAVYRFNR